MWSAACDDMKGADVIGGSQQRSLYRRVATMEASTSLMLAGLGGESENSRSVRDREVEKNRKEG